MNPHERRAHHSGKRMRLMHVQGVGVLPAPVPIMTCDVGNRTYHCPCGQDVLTPEPDPLCPSCRKPLPDPWRSVEDHEPAEDPIPVAVEDSEPTADQLDFGNEAMGVFEPPVHP